jgi:hypothetical protein
MSYEDDIRAVSVAAANEALIIINRRIHDEARRRDWCSDFDDFIEHVNHEAGFTALAPRQRQPRVKRVRTVVEFDVDVDYYPGDVSDWVSVIRTYAGGYDSTVDNLTVESQEWPVTS